MTDIQVALKVLLGKLKRFLEKCSKIGDSKESEMKSFNM